ncbi:MAG: right-handed parallel beta-helix repeat-containing protein, partial [Verrucomicrobiota bacterium]
MILFCIGEKKSGAASTGTADFYVAPNGNDTWSGQCAEPNVKMSDGPFATLTRARDAVRKLKGKTRKKNLIVSIRGGVYPLKETLVFSLADSALKGGSITYSAFPNEQPVLSSGVPIRDWRKVEEDVSYLPSLSKGKLWVADLPPEFQRIFTLYDGADRLPRARGDGFAPTNFADATSLDKFIFPAGALRNWPDLKEGEIVIIPTADYEMGILPLAEVDETLQIATTTIPASRRIGKVKFVPISAWVENVLAVLDQPGEWVVNATTRKIYLWPRGDRPSDSI